MAHGRVRPRRALPAARVRDERPRPRDEHVDVARRSPIPRSALDRGKVLDAETVKKLGAEWGRYRDVDGDGIPYRTIPGHRHAVVLHARLRPQRARPVQRAPRRLPAQRRSPRAQARDGEELRAGADRRGRGSRRSASSAYGTSHWAIVEMPRPARGGGGHQDRLHAAARLPVLGRSRGVPRALPARLPRRAEPRRADEDAAAQRPAAGGDQPRPQRAALQRPADRRAIADRRHPGPGREEGARRRAGRGRRRRGAASSTE